MLMCLKLPKMTIKDGTDRINALMAIITCHKILDPFLIKSAEIELTEWVYNISSANSRAGHIRNNKSKKRQV